MRKCSAKPYEGKEEYIFVSYCHKDKTSVFPIIEQLVRDGYRVWYDEGIDPGSEWPEIIAQHLNECSVCIAFISENSLNSHNCRREITFALLKKKNFISIILEPVQISLGMEMQLSASQSVFKYQLSSEFAFFRKLYEAKMLEVCKGEPDRSVIVSRAEDYANEVRHPEKIREPFSDRWFVNDADEEEAKRKREDAECRRLEEEECQRRETEEAERRRLEEEEKKKKKAKCYIHRLRREKTNEIIDIEKDKFIIGRSEMKADYVIAGETISRNHAMVVIEGNDSYIVDNHSLNKTFLNGKELQPETKYELNDGDIIKIFNEKLVYFKIEI